MLEVLYNIDAPLSDSIMIHAIIHGNLDAVKFLHGIGADYSGMAMSYAQMSENQQLIDFLLENQN
jgi:ankyrin repeat protein